MWVCERKKKNLDVYHEEISSSIEHTCVRSNENQNESVEGSSSAVSEPNGQSIKLHINYNSLTMNLCTNIFLGLRH